MNQPCQRVFNICCSRANGLPATRQRVLGGSRRTISTTISRQAKPPKPSPKKVPIQARQIPAYKTPTRKTPPTTSSQTSSSSSSSSSSSQQPPNPLRYRTIPIFFGSITLFAFSAYSTYLYIIYSRPNPTSLPTNPQEQKDVSARYDTIARSFDDQVDWTEWLMGITKLRRKLAQEAHGDVLEVSIGTGRNLEFYDWDFKGFNGVGKMDEGNKAVKRGKVSSFTAVDKSIEMLEIAHEKFSKRYPGVLGVRWVVADVCSSSKSDNIPLPPPNSNERSGSKKSKYDTVIQTMGLCSVSDPIKLLRNLGDVVKEDSGRILLLEHGRGSWDWLNGILDKGAEGHASEFGCWWNRDLGRIVQESGLEVVEVRRWHGGTTWWIELRKPKVGKEGEAEAEEVLGSKKGKGEAGNDDIVVKEKIKQANSKQVAVKEEVAAVLTGTKKGWW